MPFLFSKTILSQYIVLLITLLKMDAHSSKYGYPSMKFGLATYLPYFSWQLTNFMYLWFLIFSIIFLKTLLFINLKRFSWTCFFADFLYVLHTSFYTEDLVLVFSLFQFSFSSLKKQIVKVLMELLRRLYINF